jgi:phage-related protein
MYGITFLGKHSFKDMGFSISEKEIGFPNKEKIKIKVPFSNMEYDFSELYGSQTYTTRSLTYTFNVLDRNGNNKEKMNSLKTVLVNWLMNSRGKQKLYDDAIPGYYFLAEVESEAAFQENWDTGTLTVEFTAYPFMISELPEGHDIWDSFNFDLDVSQVVDFNVNGSLDITLINPGTPNVTPEINTSSSMKIIKGAIEYTIQAGKTKDQDFMLESGENRLKIIGNGTISFTFYKELI